jgi:predicted GIY-YIG superfamily endonuclease
VYFIQGGNRAYIRASVDLKRRLRQHNSEIVGGSCRTCGRGPWRYIVAIEGFRTWHEALCFEWRFQYDTKRCRSIQARQSALESLLQREKWTVNSPPSKDVLLVVTHNPTEYSDPHDNYNYIKLLSIRKKRKKCTKKHKRFYGTY